MSLQTRLSALITAIGADILALQRAVDTPGVIKMYGGAAAPTGYMLCNGASYLRNSFPSLFSAIGTTYGAADSTHFNVPDLRGRAPIGVGTGDAAGATAHALGSKPTSGAGGEEKHTLTGPESGIASHTHSMQSMMGWGAGSYALPYWDGNSSRALYGGSTVTLGSTAGPTDAASSHNIMPPSTTINFIIKF